MRRNTENHRELTRKQQLDVAGFLQKVIPPESKTVVARQWNYLVTPHLYGLVNIVPTDYRNTRFGFEDDSPRTSFKPLKKQPPIFSICLMALSEYQNTRGNSAFSPKAQ